MRSKKNIEEKLARTVVKTAIKMAEKTVGRSIPSGLHEVEVPDEVKKYVTQKNNN